MKEKKDKRRRSSASSKMSENEDELEADDKEEEIDVDVGALRRKRALSIIPMHIHETPGMKSEAGKKWRRELALKLLDQTSNRKTKNEKIVACSKTTLNFFESIFLSRTDTFYFIHAAWEIMEDGRGKICMDYLVYRFIILITSTLIFIFALTLAIGEAERFLYLFEIWNIILHLVYACVLIWLVSHSNRQIFPTVAKALASVKGRLEKKIPTEIEEHHYVDHPPVAAPEIEVEVDLEEVQFEDADAIYDIPGVEDHIDYLHEMNIIFSPRDPGIISRKEVLIWTLLNMTFASTLATAFDSLFLDLNRNHPKTTSAGQESHDNSKYKTDVHLFSSIAVLLDVILISIPIRLLHFIYPVLYLIFYLVFTFILSKYRGMVLYSHLDWDKNWRDSYVHAGIWILLVIAMHIVIVVIGVIRDKLIHWVRLKRVEHRMVASNSSNSINSEAEYLEDLAYLVEDQRKVMKPPTKWRYGIKIESEEDKQEKFNISEIFKKLDKVGMENSQHVHQGGGDCKNYPGLPMLPEYVQRECFEKSWKDFQESEEIFENDGTCLEKGHDLEDFGNGDFHKSNNFINLAFLNPNALPSQDFVVMPFIHIKKEVDHKSEGVVTDDDRTTSEAQFKHEEEPEQEAGVSNATPKDTKASEATNKTGSHGKQQKKDQAGSYMKSWQGRSSFFENTDNQDKYKKEYGVQHAGPHNYEVKDYGAERKKFSVELKKANEKAHSTPKPVQKKVPGPERPRSPPPSPLDAELKGLHPLAVIIGLPGKNTNAQPHDKPITAEHKKPGNFNTKAAAHAKEVADQQKHAELIEAYKAELQKEKASKPPLNKNKGNKHPKPGNSERHDSTASDDITPKNQERIRKSIDIAAMPVLLIDIKGPNAKRKIKGAVDSSNADGIEAEILKHEIGVSRRKTLETSKYTPTVDIRTKTDLDHRPRHLLNLKIETSEEDKEKSNQLREVFSRQFKQNSEKSRHYDFSN